LLAHGDLTLALVLDVVKTGSKDAVCQRDESLDFVTESAQALELIML
jgi:hypothetical protein